MANSKEKKLYCFKTGYLFYTLHVDGPGISKIDVMYKL